MAKIMEKPMKILVCGDIHGVWAHLNILMNRRQPDIILQCGDMGYWPNFHGVVSDGTGKKKWDLFGIRNKSTRIYWCDGNHENHLSLKELGNCSAALGPGIFYMKRGSILELPDKREVLFFGGARSIDREYRTVGVDWFPEETIGYRDLENLPEEKIDIVISHTCPVEFDMGGWKHTMTGLVYKDRLDDPSRKALSYILDKYRPKLWYFGHFHQYMEGSYQDCRWWCLNMSNEDGWWVQLDEVRQ